MKLFQGKTLFLVSLIILYLLSLSYVTQFDSLYFVQKQQREYSEGKDISIVIQPLNNSSYKKFTENFKEIIQYMLANEYTFSVEVEEWIEDFHTEILIVNDQEGRIKIPVQNKKRGVFIGKNLYSRLANPKVITIQNSPYPVTGKLGEKGVTNGLFDSSILISSETFFKGEIKISSDSAVVNLYNQSKIDIDRFSKYINEKVDYLENQDEVLKLIESKTYSTEEVSTTLRNKMFGISFFLILGILLISYFWIEEHREEYSIKKILGATKLELFKETGYQFLVVAVTCFITSYLIQSLSIYFDIPYFGKVRNSFYILIINIYSLFVLGISTFITVLSSRIQSIEFVARKD